MRTLLSVVLLAALSGCSLSVRITRKRAVPAPMCTGEPTFDDNGAVDGCDDYTEKPDSNHYPACSRQTELPCENVT